MDLLKANRQRVGAGLILFVLVALSGLALTNHGRPWEAAWEQASYDWLHRLSGPNPIEGSPVVLVYLDLASYKARELDPLKPWPRELHAQLLRKLMADGARAVLFDIVFSGSAPGSAADEGLAQAIRESKRVVLASECNYDASHMTSEHQPGARSHSIIPPAEDFARGAAAAGMAIQAIDRDYAVRRYVAGFSEAEPALTWAAAKWLGVRVTQAPDALPAANRHWIRYYGPPLSIPHVSYSEALDRTGAPPGFFRDKIVFVGARPWLAQFHERRDEVRSPYYSWGSSELFMPGVEVHATELLNLLRGDLLRRLDARSEALWLLACAALAGGGLVWLRPIPATFVALAGAGVAMAAAMYGFARGVWFPWLLVSGVQIPIAWAGSGVFNSLEWYRARRRLEAAERSAEAKIREQAALIDKARDAIVVQDLSGLALYLNPSAEQLYGWSTEELRQNGRLGEIFLPDAQAAKAARTATLAGGEWNGELRQQTRDGRVVIVASRWTLIRDETGQPNALLMLSTDVTEQKQLETQLLRTQRLNTIGALAGGMAHDLNNALAPILMGVQLLRRKSNDEEARHLLQLMETSTHRGAEMVRQVLLFARGREGEVERLELDVLVRELEQLARETFPKHITVESFLPRDLWPVRGNPTQLHQVLLNLSVNARDAMPKGGKLSFAADNVELDAIDAAAIPHARPGQFVSLLVSDTGTGMPPEIRAKIFEPFFTTKGEGRGTGLGLSTVLRIVKAHEGFLRVESQSGEGTTFEIFLPRDLEKAPQAEQLVSGLARGNGETILLAEDEEAIRELLTAELTSSGYRVLAAANGAEAVALFRQHASEVRLFITDGAMPVLDGPGAVAALRQCQPELPVILTSGTSEVEEALKVSVVSKPFSLTDILAAIDQNLSKGIDPAL